MSLRLCSLILCGGLLAGAEAGAGASPDQTLAAIAREVARLERTHPASAAAQKAWQSAAARARVTLIRVQVEPPSGDTRERERVRNEIRDLQRRLRSLTAGAAGTAASAEPTGTGGITGTVTAAASGAPLTGVTVYASRRDPSFYSSAVTDAAGRYEIGGLPGGDYHLQTSSGDQGYLDEVYDDIACGISSCFSRLDGQSPEPTLVSVSERHTVDRVDFALEVGGRIAGRITDGATGAPLAGALLTFVLDETYANLQAETDADGRYLTGRGLPAGVYRGYVVAPGYIAEFYDNVSCPQLECTGTPIAVALGATTAGIDFALDRGGAISGTVTDARTRKAVGGVFMAAFSWPDVETATTTVTDASGRYALDGLPGGQYLVMSYGIDQGYLAEGYKDVRCDRPCFVPLGLTPIAVKLGGERRNINLALDRGATVSGRVVDANTGLPLAGAYVTLDRLDAFDFSDGITDADGRYVTLFAMTPGTWAAYVDAPGYLSELYRNVDCFPFCNLSKATPIVAGLGATIDGIDFTPSVGGSISGRVTDRNGKLPIADAQISIFDGSGSFAVAAHSDKDGRFQSRGLPTGTYFVLAQDLSFPDETRRYVDELYRDLPCPGGNCAPLAGTPVAVTLGQPTSGIDFALDVGGKIAGHLTDSVTGAPIFSFVAIYDNANLQFVGSGRPNRDGFYLTDSPLPRGEYLAVTITDGYLDELFDDVPCETSCNADLGQVIRVQPGRTTSGIDFALAPQP